MSTEVSLSDLIRAFTSMQRDVVRAFFAANAAIEEWSQVSAWPSQGFFYVGGEEWTFQRHGKGQRFVRERDQCVVDVHEGLSDYPNAVDAWRLFQYARSMSMVWVEHNGKSYPVEMEHLRSLLGVACRGAGAREVKPGVFELSDGPTEQTMH